MLSCCLLHLFKVIGFGKEDTSFRVKRLIKDISEFFELPIVELLLGRELHFKHYDKVSLGHGVFVEGHALSLNHFLLV